LKVLVRGHGDIKRVIGSGRRTVELGDRAKVKDLILELGGRIEGSERALLGGRRLVDSDLVVLVNGRNIRALGGTDTVLKDGDSVAFMPVIVGG
jgi:molybdopterin converting factor small subunit